MRTQNLQSRITINPEVLVGKPTIRGVRISVEQILTALAAGILKEKPSAELRRSHRVSPKKAFLGESRWLR